MSTEYDRMANTRKLARTVTAGELAAGDTFAGAGTVHDYAIPAGAVRRLVSITRDAEAGTVDLEYVTAHGKTISRTVRDSIEFYQVTTPAPEPAELAEVPEVTREEADRAGDDAATYARIAAQYVLEDDIEKARLFAGKYAEAEAIRDARHRFTVYTMEVRARAEEAAGGTDREWNPSGQ